MYQSAHKDANLYKREIVDNVIQIFKEVKIPCQYLKHKSNKKQCVFKIVLYSDREPKFYTFLSFIKQELKEIKNVSFWEIPEFNKYVLGIKIVKSDKVEQILYNIYEFSCFLENKIKEFKETFRENLSNR